MGFKDALKHAPHELTAAEKRISEILLEDPHGAPLLTAAQLAERANAHESTVVRFAQKLGYSGYLAMRLDLASDSIGSTARTTKQPGGDEASLERVIRGQIDVLERLNEHVSQEIIDESMKELMQAQNIYIIASGLLGPLADFLSRKIALIGYPSIVLNQSGTELGVRIANIKPHDFVIVFVLASEYEIIQPIEEELVELGIKVLLITDQPTLTYQPKSPFVISVPRSELKHGVFVVLAAISYALDYSLIHQTHQATQQITK